MTDTHEDHRVEAERQLKRRVRAMEVYAAAAENGVDVYDDSEWEFDGEWFTSTISTDDLVELGPLSDYGLAWVKATTNHLDETVTYQHQLSTGGPGDEFEVTFDYRGNVESVVYVYLPWFDRVEIDMTGDETVTNFYATHFGDLIGEGVY